MPTLNWIGKDKVVAHHQNVPYKVLEHKYGFCDGETISSETNSGNLIIHGDNLEALKSLLPRYQGKVNTMVSRIIDSLKYNEIPESDIRDYVKDVVGRLDDEKLSELNENYLQAQEKFKNHIDRLLLDYEIAEFRKQLDTNGITCEPSYKFPNRLTYKKTAYGLTRGLYSEEDGDINGFEYNVIREVANVENVVFWHRNPERGNGFGINGFINHYPDFIIRLKSGRIVLLETKGDDRDNSDSRNKLSLGMTWANKAGDNYRYYMVFDKAYIDGALNVQEFIERLKGL